MNIRLAIAVGLIVVVTGCSSRQTTTASDPLQQIYTENTVDVFTLQFAYNSCKNHLATNGKGTARICEDIVKASLDDKTKILARAILDDFRIAFGGSPFSPKTLTGSRYFAFMKMQSERYLNGEIGWNEMDYTIMSKGNEMNREIRESTTFGR